MAFIKKSTVSSVVVVSSSVYNCTECGHAEIAKGVELDENKKCPLCKAKMTIISTSSEGYNSSSSSEDEETDTGE